MGLSVTAADLMGALSLWVAECACAEVVSFLAVEGLLDLDRHLDVFQCRRES